MLAKSVIEFFGLLTIYWAQILRRTFAVDVAVNIDFSLLTVTLGNGRGGYSTYKPPWRYSRSFAAQSSLFPQGSS